jgi:NAD dependent epimerase/dehydratase family enzyme
MVSQDPVTNGDFTKVLAGALGRPALLPVPPFVLRMMLGDLADETLLASQQVVPKALIDAGFQFRHKDIVRAIDLLVNHNL